MSFLENKFSKYTKINSASTPYNNTTFFESNVPLPPQSIQDEKSCHLQKQQLHRAYIQQKNNRNYNKNDAASVIGIENQAKQTRTKLNNKKMNPTYIQSKLDDDRSSISLLLFAAFEPMSVT